MERQKGRVYGGSRNEGAEIKIIRRQRRGWRAREKGRHREEHEESRRDKGYGEAGRKDIWRQIKVWRSSKVSLREEGIHQMQKNRTDCRLREGKTEKRNVRKKE